MFLTARRAIYSSFLFLLVHSAQATAETQGPITIWNGGPNYDLGDGVASISSDARYRCVKFINPEITRSFSEKTEIQTASSFESLSNSFGLSVYGSLFGASVAANFARERFYSENKEYFLVSVKVISETERLPEKLSLTDDGSKLLQSPHGEGVFYTACGDSLVSSITRGAQLLVVFESDKIESGARTDFMLELAAASKGGAVSQDMIEKMSKYNMKASIFKIGMRDHDVPDVNDQPAVLKYAQTFGSTVASGEEDGKINPETGLLEATLYRYDRLPAFLIANPHITSNFDDLGDITNRALTAYAQALHSLDIVLGVENDKGGYLRKRDMGMLAATDLEQLIGQKAYYAQAVENLSGLVRACAKSTAPTDQCSIKKVTELTAKPLPVDTLLAPACVAENQSSTCMAATRVDGVCACTQCSMFPGHSPMDQTATCTGMVPNASFNADISVKLHAHPGGNSPISSYTFVGDTLDDNGQAVEKQIEQQQGHENSEEVNSTLEGKTDKDGIARIRLRFNYCADTNGGATNCDFQATGRFKRGPDDVGVKLTIR